jgi:4-hydroxyacetophenone monooxygenase
MVLQTETVPITEGDAQIRGHLKDAFVPCLLAALTTALDDYKYIPETLAPTPIEDRIAALFDTTGGFSEEQTAQGRELAFEGLKELRKRQKEGTLKPYVHDAAHEEMVKRCVLWLTGGKAGEDYVPLCIEELAPFGEDLRAPAWKAEVPGVKVENEPPVAEINDTQGVVIIGSGMSGILAAIRMKQAGVPFVVLEKNSDVGGTESICVSRVTISPHAHPFWLTVARERLPRRPR